MMRVLFPAVLMLAQSIAPGSFHGTYTSTAGSSAGDLRLSLKEDAGNWTGEASFTFEGENVPCRVTKIEINGAKMVFAYEFDLGGYKLISTLTGELSGDSWTGKYQTKPVGADQQIDAGTWKAAKK